MALKYQHKVEDLEDEIEDLKEEIQELRSQIESKNKDGEEDDDNHSIDKFSS